MCPDDYRLYQYCMFSTALIVTIQPGQVSMGQKRDGMDLARSRIERAILVWKTFFSLNPFFMRPVHLFILTINWSFFVCKQRMNNLISSLGENHSPGYLQQGVKEVLLGLDPRFVSQVNGPEATMENLKCLAREYLDQGFPTLCLSLIHI